ncbi:MAG: MBL fold metallo-hydrolase [Candidatus Heimdallarchaeota archaeon]|nr:MBL fold metallo-hydrolase [Candidatus Heimdallarchaeota archaeon]MCK4877826.1 MBL fold metallo-hydrolase [Candidatus Heimdallarchaeota archaeon]
MPTVFKYDKGIKFLKKPENLTLIADPTTAKAANSCDVALITHAHTDHSIAFPNEGIKVFSTKIASELYEKLTSRKTKNTDFVEYDKKLRIKDVEVEFIQAGHLLGAAQIIFYFDDITVCYTGDLSTVDMISVPKATIPKENIDVLIIEATYGKSDLFFESRETIKISILNWIAESLQKKIIPVINIGHLGGAQEIIAFLNEMLSVEIYCDNRTSEINKIYKREGINLKWNSFDILNDEEFKEENSVILLPRAAKELPVFLKDHKTSRSIVTGQASRFSFSNFEQAFPFSMHANCNELLEHIKAIDPKKVYTIYGFDSDLAAIIRQKMKIPSRPLKLAKKKFTLEEFL